MYDKPTKYLVAVPIADRTMATLSGVIHDFCAPGSTGTTDEWSGYNFLRRDGFPHFVCCHKDGFKNPVTGACTNGVERCWVDWKSYVRRHGPISIHLIPVYLNDWLYKFNLERANLTWPQIVNTLLRALS